MRTRSSRVRRNGGAICIDCRPTSGDFPEVVFHVGPSPTGSCAICGYLYCQACFKAMVMTGTAVFQLVMPDRGAETLTCPRTACAAIHPFTLQGGAVVLLPPRK